MPPYPKRNRCVILYDLSSKNQLQLRRALFKIYSFYYFRKSKDLVNLVLVNCEKTKNRKQRQSGNGYEYIYETSHEELLFDPAFTKCFMQLKNTYTCDANWKEALAVALKILKEDKTPRIITYRILYLTDLWCSSESTINLDDIVLELNQNNIFLSIVGPDVKYPKTITSFEEVPSLIKDIIFINENDNLKEMKTLVERCKHAFIADIKMGLQLFFNYKNPTGKQNWPVPLTIGSKIAYSVGTSKFRERKRGFKLKRMNQFRNQTIFVSAEDNTKIYAQEDVRKGIVKHGKFIPLANNDKFKAHLNRMFSVVFITKIKNIPEYMMKGPACYTVIATGKKQSPAGFYSLLMRLDKARSCLVVKRVYNKGCKAMYMALIPNTSKKCFRAIQLPYGFELPFEWGEEDLHKHKEEISEEVEEFLDCLNIDSKSFSLNVPMTPNTISASKGGKLVDLATEKLLEEPDLHLEEVDINPFSTGIDAEIGKKLREMWPSRGPAKAEVEVKNEENDYDADYF